MSLAPLQPGTAVLLMDDWDKGKLKKAFIVRKVGFEGVNQYEVAFACSIGLSSTKFVKEKFVEDGGDVMPRTDWKLGHPALKS